MQIKVQPGEILPQMCAVHAQSPLRQQEQVVAALHGPDSARCQHCHRAPALSIGGTNTVSPQFSRIYYHQRFFHNALAPEIPQHQTKKRITQPWPILRAYIRMYVCCPRRAGVVDTSIDELTPEATATAAGSSNHVPRGAYVPAMSPRIQKAPVLLSTHSGDRRSTMISTTQPIIPYHYHHSPCVCSAG